MGKHENLYIFYDAAGQVYGWTDSKKIAKAFHKDRPSLQRKKFRVDDMTLSLFEAVNNSKKILQQMVLSTSDELNGVYAKYYGELLDLFSPLEEEHYGLQSLQYIRKRIHLQPLLEHMVFQQEEEYFLGVEIDHERMLRYFLRNARKTKR